MTIPVLDELLKTYEVSSAFQGNDDGEENPERKAPPLTNQEALEFVPYLEHPTKCGFWRLTANWKGQGKFTEYLFNEVSPRLFETQIDAKSGKQKNRFTADASKEIVLDLTVRMSTPFEVCWALGASGPEKERTAGRTLKGPFMKAFGDEIDGTKFVSAFPEASATLKADLLYDGFAGRFWTGEPCRFKSGLFFVLEAPVRGRLLAASQNKQPLVDASNFLLHCDKVENVQIERVFSPEEEVFQPYFLFLSAAFPVIISDQRIKPQFRQAFKYFTDEDYIHCVGTLGLIAEDYLTRVYESYLRDPCPKGLTLGQIYDHLHAHLRELVKKPKAALTSLDKTYDKIKSLDVIDLSTDVDKYRSGVSSALRELANNIRSDRKYFSEKIDDLNRHDKTASIFPVQITDNIDELIRYRNAASHKTRVPVGSYEALRTLYCLTSFVMWWRKERAQTDWSAGKDEILLEAIQAVK